MQSILAVGYEHRVDILCQQRMTYFAEVPDPGWGLCRTINITGWAWNHFLKSPHSPPWQAHPISHKRLDLASPWVAFNCSWTTDVPIQRATPNHKICNPNGRKPIRVCCPSEWAPGRLSSSNVASMFNMGWAPFFSVQDLLTKPFFLDKIELVKDVIVNLTRFLLPGKSDVKTTMLPHLPVDRFLNKNQQTQIVSQWSKRLSDVCSNIHVARQ